MNIVLLTQGEVDSAEVAHLDGNRARHLRDVLKATPGQSVRIGLIDGPAGVGVVTALDPERVWLQCSFDAEPPPRPAVDLLLAVPRPKVLRRLWAQVAAVGVGRIILTNAARVERNYFDTHWLAPETYEPLLIEGLQQARDTHLPVVSIHRQFRPLVEEELAALFPTGLRLVAQPGTSATIGDTVRAHSRDRVSASIEETRSPPQRVLLAIGPEGGWNDFEMACLAAQGFLVASMGRRALRTDTACVAALALVHDALR